jgi:DEAD/DEAH box helicase domain-containing protein
MRKHPVVLDLETKHTFREYSDPRKLGISVAAIYDYQNDQGRVFLESELASLYPILEAASYVIGFNIRSFDLPVLSAYYPGDISTFLLFDILDDIREKIGRRIALNDLIAATLGKKKTGHGLMAIDYFKEGKWEELKKYCLDDVMLTKALFEEGIAQKNVYYLNEAGKVVIPVDWKKYLDEAPQKDTALTLPF